MKKITYNTHLTARLSDGSREIVETRLGLSIHEACDYIRELGERGGKARSLLIETLVDGENYQEFLDRTQPGAIGGGLRISGYQLNEADDREDKIENLLRNHLDLAADGITPHSQEQRETIAEAISMAVSSTDRIVDYAWSDRLAERDGTTYAVFGPLARQLLRESRCDDCEFLPVIVDGRMLERSPEEGSSGIAYLMRRVGHPGKAGRWAVIWMNTCTLTTASLPVDTVKA